MDRQSSEGVQGSENTAWCYHGGQYHHKLPKPTECTPPGENPSVNYGFWVITMCHCRFISGGDGGGGVWIMGGLCMGGGRSFMGTLYFPLNFAMNLKLP